jgi:PAS domain S-box-containing protein
MRKERKCEYNAAMASSRPGTEPFTIQLLVDSIPALIHTARPDGYLDYFNKPWLEFLGVTLEKMVGWNWTAFIHPEDLDGILTKWRASLATGEIFEYETRVLSANGEYRWMFHHKVPLRDASGKIVKWYGTSIDIEDRKRAEVELRRSDALAEERLRLVVDTTPAMINSCRPDGHLDYVNKGWLDYFGLSLAAALDRADVLNMTIPSETNGEGGDSQPIIHPEDLPGLRSHWESTLISGKPGEHEARARRFDGVYRWHLFRAVPLCDETGRSSKWYVSGFDIEDRKRVEEELRKSEYYLAEGQRLAHIGSWAFVPDGFEYWSPELFRMHGLDPASKPPGFQEYLNLVHPQDRQSMAALINGILVDASPFDATKRIVRPDGEVRHIRCVGLPVLENQNLKRYVGSAIDVTEQEVLTQRLRRREAYLAEAQKLSHTGSWSWNPATGEPGYWSEECYRVLGFDPAGPPPPLDTIFQRVQPDDARAAIREQFERGVRENADFGLEMSLLHPTKGIRNIRSTGHAVVDTDGQLREIVGTVMDITEQKRAEAAIRRSGAYLAEAQRLSHTGSFGWTVSSGELFWSDETFRIFEYDRSVKPTLESLVQRVHPEERVAVKAVIDRAFAGAPEFEHAYRLLMPDGRLKHVHAIAHGLRDASGSLEFVGAVTDVTGHMMAEAALRSSEADLLEAQRLSHTGSWRNDVLTGIVRVSPEMHRIFDIRPGEDASTAEFFFGRIHPEDRPIEAQTYERASLAKTGFESDYRIVLPDGSIKHIHNVGHPVLNESGELREFVGTAIDITDQRHAAAVIREQGAELRLIVDLVPQLIAVYGANLERFYANRTALEYLGLGLDEWRQDRFAHSTHPDDEERSKTAADQALSSGSAYEVELRLRKYDGSYRWFLARYNPVPDDKGQITRWYVTATDIEDRKQAEDTLRRENVALREEIDKASMFEEIVGSAPALRTVLSRISKVAKSDSTVLITGETGTGKELVARAIHRRSDRRPRAFVSVNCAAIPRDLIGSELFGHEKGAFTGATQQRLGRFELANGGTIFLDEVGDLPPETQIALLRVLQEHEFERVGGTRQIRVNVRVIAATNRDLEAAINAGSFRSDLFYRLNVFPIEIPSLRERRVDIPLLVEYFIDRYARKAGKSIRGVSKKTLELLQSYPWPGNIRELQNVIERSVILCETEIFSIDENWLPQPLPLTPESRQQTELSQTLVAQEKSMIEAALKASLGRVSGATGAAVKLGIPRSTLESKIRALEINKNRFRS